MAFAVVNINLVAAQCNGVRRDDAAQHLVNGQAVDTGEPAGLADADGGADGIKNHVLKAGDVLLEHLDNAWNLQMAVNFTLGEAEQVGAVTAGDADSVDKNFTGNR